MRFQTLAEMLTDLRGEAGISQNVAHGVTAIEPHKALLRRIQEELWLAFDWPHLNTSAPVTLLAGARYAAYPDTFIFDGIEDVSARGSDGRWFGLTYGIGPAELNYMDSDADARSFPITRWQNYMQPTGDTSNNMFEVWPIPDKDTAVRFTGKRSIFPLDTDDQTSTIDGPLIVLRAAAELLARQKSDDASVKMDAFMQRLKFLKLRQQNKTSVPGNLAGGPTRRPLRAGIDYMPRRS